MKLLGTEDLSLPGVKIVRFGRFADERGYFTEHFRRSQFTNEIPFLSNVTFVQANESHSKKGVVRGLHFQWNPFMGKLVRTVHGTMIDLFLDIRKGSPTYGKVSAHKLQADPWKDSAEWIWIPPGFAHGNYFAEDTTIEYFCSGEYSPGFEAAISPLAADIDWAPCEGTLKAEIDAALAGNALMSAKDRTAFSLEAWTVDERSNNFRYAELV